MQSIFVLFGAFVLLVVVVVVAATPADDDDNVVRVQCILIF